MTRNSETSWSIGKPFTHMPLFTKQYELVPIQDGDVLKLGR